MIIYRDSWHYRLMKKLDMSPSHSLCVYLSWQLLVVVPVQLALIAIALASTIAAFGIVVWMMASIVWHPFLSWDILWGDNMFTSEWWTDNTVFVWGMVLWLLGGVGVLVHMLSNQPTNPNPDGPMMAYYKAKKEKICPTIRFIGKE